jgi:hypothetical protein
MRVAWVDDGAARRLPAQRVVERAGGSLRHGIDEDAFDGFLLKPFMPDLARVPLGLDAQRGEVAS